MSPVNMADYRENVVSLVLPLCSNNASSSLISQHQLFGVKKPWALQDQIGQINSGLNSSKKRLESLRQLACLVEQCAAAVFSSHCQTWLNLLLQCLQSHGSPLVHQYTMYVLSRVIERVSDFPELAREVGSSYIARLLPVVLSPKSRKVDEASVACINTCIVNFPGPTGSFKSKIEVVLTDQLDQPEVSGVILRCYALLARCGTGGNQGIKHREGWSRQCNNLISTLHSLLTQLYEGLETGQEDGDDQIFSSRPLATSKPETVATLVSRFQTLCGCLDTLMREPFPTWIPLPAEDILDFVCRALAVLCTSLINSKSTDRLLLLSYLPLLHCSTLRVLFRLVICCKKLLLPQGSVIFRLCVQCLTTTRTQSSEPGQERPFSKLREAVYNVLMVWLQLTGSACQGIVDDELEDFLQEIFHDIQPQSESLKIDSSVKSVAGGGVNPPPAKRKKKGRSGYQEMSQGGASLWSRRRHANSGTAVSALKVLQLLVTFGGNALNSQMFQVMQQRIGTLVMAVQQNQPPPYTSSACRQSLYETLLATVCPPRPDVPSFLQGALALFQQGKLDSDFQVTNACQNAVQRCTSLTHTTTPNVRTSLMIPTTTSISANNSSTTAGTTGIDDFTSITSSVAAEIQMQTFALTEKSASGLSSSGDMTQVQNSQQEKPTSTSGGSMHEGLNSSEPHSSASDVGTSGRIVSSLSSSFSENTDKNSRKRKQSGNSESSESEPERNISASAKTIMADFDDDEENDDSHADNKTDQVADDRQNKGKAHGKSRKVSKMPDKFYSEMEREENQGKGTVKEADGNISSSVTEQSEDVQEMLMTFVDAGPDSD